MGDNKTIKEWLERLPEPWRSKALKQLPKDRADFLVSHMSSAVLRFVVNWRETEEGSDYWYDLFTNISAQERDGSFDRNHPGEDLAKKEEDGDDDVVDYWVAKSRLEKEKEVMELLRKMNEQPMNFVNHEVEIEKDRDYWKERCLAAERYIDAMSDDEVYPNDEYSEWLRIKNKRK